MIHQGSFFASVILIMVLTATPVIANDCPVEKVEGLSGTLTGGGQLNCGMETYEITFDRFFNMPVISYVVLEWRLFNVPGNMPFCVEGHVKVYTGCQNKVEIAEFCSGNMLSKLPHNIYAFTKCLTVELNHTDWKQKGTFVAWWYQLKDKRAKPVPDCTVGSMKEPQGIVGTPNWPRTATTDCEFQLENEATNGYVIHVMDIAEGGETCESPDQRIKVKDTKDFSKGKYICSPKRVESRYFKPTVQMQYIQGSDWNWNKRGFVLGWVAFKDPYYEASSSGVSGGAIAAAIIVPLIILILVVFLVIFILKRKRGFVFHNQGPRFKPAATEPPSGEPEAVTFDAKNGTTLLNMEPKPYPTQQNTTSPSAPTQTEPPLNPTVKIIDPSQQTSTPSAPPQDDQQPSGSNQQQEKPHKKKRRKHKKEGDNADGGDKEDKSGEGRKKKHRKRRPKDKTPKEGEDVPEEQTTDLKAPLVEDDPKEEQNTEPPVQEVDPPPTSQDIEPEPDTNKPLLSEETNQTQE